MMVNDDDNYVGVVDDGHSDNNDNDDDGDNDIDVFI